MCVFEFLTGVYIRFHTHFHLLLAEASLVSPEPAHPQLHARIGSRLPERELRVLYRISQLTGVLLEEDVTSQGVDTSSLTSLPSCDHIELQFARRCLHRWVDIPILPRPSES